MARLKEKLWGRSSKDLLPGERALPFNLAPAIIAGVGGLLVLASLFMPALEAGDPNLNIADNLVIESDPWLLLCFIAAVIGTVRYWKTGSSGSANVALYGGVLFLVLDVFTASTAKVYIGSFEAEGGVSAALGLWTAGVGSLLVGYGGLLMRFPRFGFGLAGGPAAPADEEALFSGAKTCPKCAEKIKAAARVCRFCHHEFQPLSQA